MRLHSEFVSLEYSQFFGALSSAILAYDLVNCRDNLFKIELYLPLQFNLKLLEQIVNLNSENETILTEDFIKKIANFNDAQISIILFPLIVYCYQNIIKLEEELSRLINSNYYRKTTGGYHLKITAMVIFLILKGNCHYQNIFNEINQQIEFKNISEHQLLQRLIHRKLPLIQVESLIQSEISSLSHQGIYQALYSFLTMSHNWEISLHRSAQFSQQTQETTVLTGLLLGLHHGYLGIPFHWRKTLDYLEEKTSSQIENISQKLVAQWQGRLQN